MTDEGLAVRQPEGVVGRIVRRTLRDVATRREAKPRASLERAGVPPPRDLAAALRADGLGLIAELKPRSPSRGVLRPDLDPDAQVAAYRPYAAAVSVLCDGPSFGGSLGLLARARAALEVPVLCKDFVVTEYQVAEAAAAGADAVLLLAALLPPPSLGRLLGLCGELGLGALVEVHDLEELKEVLDTPAAIVGINSRDLRTLAVDLRRVEELAPLVPAGRVRVAESGIHRAEDVERVRPLVDAVLIGTELMIATDPASRIRELGWLPCR